MNFLERYSTILIFFYECWSNIHSCTYISYLNQSNAQTHSGRGVLLRERGEQRIQRLIGQSFNLKKMKGSENIDNSCRIILNVIMTVAVQVTLGLENVTQLVVFSYHAQSYESDTYHYINSDKVVQNRSPQTWELEEGRFKVIISYTGNLGQATLDSVSQKSD